MLEELELDQDDFVDNEPMMPGSDDEFSDLEDVEDKNDNVEDDENDGSDNHASPDPHAQSPTSDTLPCWSQTLSSIAIPHQPCWSQG